VTKPENLKQIVDGPADKGGASSDSKLFLAIGFWKNKL
jgi:hypothetical protein